MDILERTKEPLEIDPAREYQELTVKLWGKGVVLRRNVSGADIASSRRFVARGGQFIVSRIDARNGAMGLVPKKLDGAVVTNDFPLFAVDTERVNPSYLNWLSKTTGFVGLCQRASEGTTNRVRLQETKFLSTEVPFPTLEQQKRVVAHLDQIASSVRSAHKERARVEELSRRLLLAAYHKIADGAARMPLCEVAPLLRRPVVISPTARYEQIAARSFGRGTFHKPPIHGADVTWQKLFLVEAGDILISNIKAWEGAIAVVAPDDDGRVGSHRYLTCVPRPEVATARFVAYHLLTPAGLHDVGMASPGSADRNRTLGVKALRTIEVPVPSYQAQLWFGDIYAKVDEARSIQREVDESLAAVVRAALHRLISVSA
jgi:type I restriction enzyme S subunit